MSASADISGKFALDVQAVNGLRVPEKKTARRVLKLPPGSSRPYS